MKRIHCIVLAAALCVVLAAGAASAHCEIPCGIYDDRARVESMREHLTTIEKSMKQIEELAKGSPVVYNQLVRWVVNKEEHANRLQEIVTQYFMTQRIKPDAKDYGKKLEALHHILVYAMKCKQTVDPENAAKAREAIERFEKLYFEKAGD